jgi:hypothetical protein
MSPVRLSDSSPFISREQMLPAAELSYQERLNRAGAVDLTNNASIEQVGGGYMRVRPVDASRRHGR